MTIGRASILAIVAWLIIANPTPARAQSAEAEVLFREGKRLMKEGKLSEACDKLEASDRLESSVGTMLNLADCREKNKQLVAAWLAFHKAATAAKVGNDPKREAEAKRRANVLEARLAYLTISVADASRVDGLVIKRDGVVVDPALWNQGVPVDSGDYEISGEAPGHEPWSTKVHVTAEAQKLSVEVPRFKQLDQLTAKPPVVVATKPPPPATPEEPEQVDQPSPTFTGMRKASIAVAAVGVIGIAGGIIFGSKAKSTENQSDTLCPTSACGDPQGLKLNQDAKNDALYANVAFVVGGAAIAGAVVLWVVGANKPSDHVSLAPIVNGHDLGVAFGGSF
jgi:hypothetical protein